MDQTVDIEIFQTRLKELMKENRYSQKQICDLCNITEAAFSRYMSLNRLPKASILANIANILHTTSDYLLGNDNNYGYDQLKILLASSKDNLSKNQKLELTAILMDEYKWKGEIMQNVYRNVTKKGKTKYNLPTWRIEEIISAVLQHLLDERFYENDFDVIKMIEKNGIVLKPYSEFNKTQIKKLEELVKKGVFYSTFTEEKFICYNNNLDTLGQLFTILHEYGHFYLRHTQQSENGEFEANYFALSMIIFLCIEERFHLFKKSTKDDFKNIMYRNLPFNKKEVS